MRETMAFQRRPLPPLARVGQALPSARIADARRETRRRLIDSGLLRQLRSGQRIAITAGSRGFGGFVEIPSGIADAVKEAGGEPFIIPAMGSHGGATAEGQTEILRRLGATEASVGAPLHATMETVALGESDTGAVAHADKLAFEADGIIVLGRTKTHPESATQLASGLLKMIVAGLGKQRGAQQAHNHGLWESVRAVPRVTMARAKILCGVSVIENAFRQPAQIEVVPASYDAFLDADLRLLEASKVHAARIPFDQLDLLIVDELGKDVSGTGMDLNVIGQWRLSGGEHKPDFKRIAVLSLTAASLGNGLGIGLADFTTMRFAREFDSDVTYVNLLTATEPGVVNTREGVLPLALPSDREAVEVALYSALAPEQPRVCRIRNTGRLDEFWVSEALLDEVRENSQLSVISPPAPLAYDAAGNLLPE